MDTSEPGEPKPHVPPAQKPVEEPEWQAPPVRPYRRPRGKFNALVASVGCLSVLPLLSAIALGPWWSTAAVIFIVAVVLSASAVSAAAPTMTGGKRLVLSGVLIASPIAFFAYLFITCANQSWH